MRTDQWEIEDHNNSLNPANGIYGSILAYTDSDTYTFSLPSDGYIYPSIRGLSNVKNAQFTVGIYTSWGSKIDEYELSSNGIEQKGGRIGLASGTYMIKVSGNTSVNSISYFVNPNYVKAGDWEREGSITSFDWKARVSGAILLNGGDVDEDTYNLAGAPENGKAQLSFSSGKKVDGSFTVEVYQHPWWKPQTYRFDANGSTDSRDNVQVSDDTKVTVSGTGDLRDVKYTLSLGPAPAAPSTGFKDVPTSHWVYAEGWL